MRFGNQKNFIESSLVNNMNVVHKLNSQPLLNKKTIVTIILVIIAVVVLEIWSVNRLASFGHQISKLEQTKLDLILENQVLENQIAKESSLQEAETKANYLGFSKVKNVEYIQSNNSLAEGR